MSKFYVGSEVGQLRRVMLHRPNLSLKRLTPSNCQDLLFDDVLSVERAGQEHDKFAQVLRDQNVEVFLLTNLLAETLDVPEAKTWLLQHQVSDYRLGSSLANDVRCFLADMPHRELARRLSGGLTYGEIPAAIKNMVVDTHTADGLKVAHEHRHKLALRGGPMIVLETALPIKFAETIVEALGREPERPAKFDGIEALPKKVLEMDADVAAIQALIARECQSV